VTPMYPRYGQRQGLKGWPFAYEMSGSIKRRLMTPIGTRASPGKCRSPEASTSVVKASCRPRRRPLIRPQKGLDFPARRSVASFSLDGPDQHVVPPAVVAFPSQIF